MCAVLLLRIDYTLQHLMNLTTFKKLTNILIQKTHQTMSIKKKKILHSSIA